MKCKIIFLMIISFVLNLFAQNPNWEWVNTFGNNSQDHGRAICCDENGDVYIAGSYALDINLGSFVLPDEDRNIYIAKMNSEGNYIWANHAFGSTSVFVNSVCTDLFGNVFITGYYEGGQVTFGQFEITSNGWSDIFVAKLDYNGNWVWAQNAGGDYYDEGYGITADQEGSIYITGCFRGTSYFGNHNITASGGWSVFVAKLNCDGNWLWVTGPVGCGGYDISYDISSDMNDILITGYFTSDTIDFGSSILTLTNNGYADIFVAKIDNSGSWIWAQQSNGDDEDYSWEISTNPEGISVISGGYSSSNITFGDHSLDAASNSDIFVAKIDSDGNWLWATSANGAESEVSSSVYISSENKIFTTGFFQDTVQFGDFSLSTSGSNYDRDVFVGSLDLNGNWEWVIQAGGIEYDKAFDITSYQDEEIYVIGDFQETAIFGPFIVTSTDSFYDVFVLKLNDQVDAQNIILKEGLHVSNYPNPFNPSTTVEFSIQINSEIELSIFNIKGQKIISLINDVFPKGTHSIIWNGDDKNNNPVSSGIYYFKLKVNGKTEVVKKCLLLK